MVCTLEKDILLVLAQTLTSSSMSKKYFDAKVLSDE